MTNTSTTCDEHEDEPRFLKNGRPFSSRKDLTKTIEQLFRAGVDYDDDDDDDGVPESLIVSLLPPEIVGRIANYFTVMRLDPCKTRALNCSSSLDSDSSWRMSAGGSFQKRVCCLVVSCFVLCCVVLIVCVVYLHACTVLSRF
mmetsp:Transcript_15760/g.34112  ORF Transcript_15760/g.34112 Transcript_15760/m.34112 type:complete len:143 (-) Transcript_15760:440-868(-)